MSYTADKARLGPDQADRAPSRAELAADANPRFARPEHTWSCNLCGGRYIAADIRDRHQATCAGEDPWMLGRTHA